jgi:proteasome accessory factor C
MPRTSADDRLRRILAVVPWVVASDGPLIAEVCDRFGYASEAELRADFELLFMCGVHPFTPDALITVDLADGRVWVRYADYFSRPLRLSPAEALSLLASSAGLLAADGHDNNGPLARGLAKLASALGVDPEEVVDVELGPAPPAILAVLRQAVTDHRQVELDYYGFGRDAHSTRLVDPTLVYSAQGQWYVAGYCHRAHDERLFRVDRIEAARLQGSVFTPRVPAKPLSVYEPRPTDPRIVLDLDPESAWVAEQYPVEAVTDLGGGRLRVALAVSGAAWLERLLLLLGPTAVVVEGDARSARDAASRVLARYGEAVVGTP